MNASNSFEDLINIIRTKSALLAQDVDDRESLGVLFMKAMHETVIDIRRGGADSDDFADLSVINLIMLGDKEGYSADEMRSFVVELKSDDTDNEDDEDDIDYDVDDYGLYD